MIPSYIADIDRMLRKLRRSELYDRMVEDYRQIENLEKTRAKEKIDRQFAELDSFINLEYEQEMGYIDRKINTYYNLYSTRMMMVLSNNTNLEHELNRLLIFIKNLDDEDRETVLRQLSGTHRLMSMGYIGKKSFERRKKSNPNRKTAGLSVGGLSEEERMAADLVIDSFGQYGGKALEAITHNEKPWTDARMGCGSEEPSHRVIAKKNMKEYFGEVAREYGIDSVKGLNRYIEAKLEERDRRG